MSAKQDNGFTEQYFYDEIVRLRQAWGTKNFWKLSDIQRKAMLDGLSLVYLNINNVDGSKATHDQIETWAMHFEATMMEYNRRELYFKARL